jgi:hypothetical protein
MKDKRASVQKEVLQARLVAAGPGWRLGRMQVPPLRVLAGAARAPVEARERTARPFKGRDGIGPAPETERPIDDAA